MFSKASPIVKSMQHEQANRDDSGMGTGCHERSEHIADREHHGAQGQQGTPPALSVCRSSTCATSQTLSDTSGGGRDSLEADLFDVAHHRGAGDGTGRLHQRDGTTGSVGSIALSDVRTALLLGTTGQSASCTLRKQAQGASEQQETQVVMYSRSSSLNGPLARPDFRTSTSGQASSAAGPTSTRHGALAVPDSSLAGSRTSSDSLGSSMAGGQGVRPEPRCSSASDASAKAQGHGLPLQSNSRSCILSASLPIKLDMDSVGLHHKSAASRRALGAMQVQAKVAAVTVLQEEAARLAVKGHARRSANPCTSENPPSCQACLHLQQAVSDAVPSAALMEAVQQWRQRCTCEGAMLDSVQLQVHQQLSKSLKQARGFLQSLRILCQDAD